MTARLEQGGRLIDRSLRLHFTFDGKQMWGHAGDTLASALLANDQMLVGRSFKYHRPRGIVAYGAEEPNALVNLGRGARFEPNQRATTTELFSGLQALSQNHWPSLDYDIGAVNSALARFLPAGFYYKMFMHPRALWKHLYEPFIRQSAGLGQAPGEADADTYEHFYAFVDVLVVGGGLAGLLAARAAAETGARVLVLEQTAHWGGRAAVDGGQVEGMPAGEAAKALVAELSARDNVTLRARCMGAGIYDHAYVLGYERLSDHLADPQGPRHRLWRIRAQQVITATGAIERPLAFANNDVPGVMLASALRDYAINQAISPGQSVVIGTNNDDAYLTALALRRAGSIAVRVVDARPRGGGALMEEARAAGVQVDPGRVIAKVGGTKRVRYAGIAEVSGTGAALERVACDAIGMSGGWSPVVHLWSHCGGKLLWDAAQAAFRPDPQRPPTGADGAGFVHAAGAANGAGALDLLVVDASVAGHAAAEAAGCTGRAPRAPAVKNVPTAPLLPVWRAPLNALEALKEKSWLDFQNDVKVTDVELAAREGFQSVEHTKRYTTLGMATDQGKLSNINGLAVLSEALDQPIPQTGTTTFRPPYTPISMGAIAGEARGEVFQPIRRTPLHDWHEAQGVEWEPVGHWRRPYAYPRDCETVHGAVMREVRNTRRNVGLLDASTLGKLIVKGPDAGRFLDMLYTNVMSTLKPGRCRYGLMCSDNGFLIDDGIVARLDEQTFLCHTTSGGADHIHGVMEEWLQTEWWDWKVWVVNVTEQFGQIAIVGPKARAVLEEVGGSNVSRAALPFMGWIDGALAGIPVRILRISFSGELSFEIAVKAGQARALWDRLVAAGEAHSMMPYGTEALHIMRAEKGFIMIGDETDGTVIPQDLGLDWAISKKKADYLGKRAQRRFHMTDPDRWKLVGLKTLDGSVLPDGAYATDNGINAHMQKRVQGRVTSTYYSPTLGRGIAMGLVQRGPQRMGEVLEFATVTGKAIKAEIVEPVFFDKAGEKQDV